MSYEEERLLVRVFQLSFKQACYTMYRHYTKKNKSIYRKMCKIYLSEIETIIIGKFQILIVIVLNVLHIAINSTQ